MTVRCCLPICPECDSPYPLLYESVRDMDQEMMCCEGCGCWFKIGPIPPSYDDEEEIEQQEPS